MKKAMTRRRKAILWTVLAAVLVLLWGVAKGYVFTPGQARRECWQAAGLEGMEEIIALPRESDREVRVYGGPDYRRYVLFSDENTMFLADEYLYLFQNGWTTAPLNSVRCAPETAVDLPEATIWTGSAQYFHSSGCFYFRADEISADVARFSVVEEITGADGQVGYSVPEADDVDIAGALEPQGLTYSEKNHGYGVFHFFSYKLFDDPQAVAQRAWVLKVERKDGSARYVPFPGPDGKEGR